MGHLVRTPENRISRRVIEKLWNSKTNIRWITEVKEDMKTLQITMDDIKGKSDKLKVLQHKETVLPIKINKQRLGRVISDEERKARSDRMKKYWATKKRRT